MYALDLTASCAIRLLPQADGVVAAGGINMTKQQLCSHIKTTLRQISGCQEGRQQTKVKVPRPWRQFQWEEAMEMEA